MELTAHLPWVWHWTAAGWAAAAAWATFVVAAAAAAFAWRQVLEARATRNDQAQPFVVVDFEPSKAGRIFLDLVIRNTGTTVATNVRMTFDPSLASTLSRDDTRYLLAESAIVRRGIPTLPPGREYRMLFERMPDRYTSDLPRSYDATVTFDDARGRPHEMRYRLDLDIYFGFMRLDVYTDHDAAKALREIEKLLQRWSAGPSKQLRVWARDEDSHRLRELEELEEPTQSS